MKISYNWLKEFLDFDHTPEQLQYALTMLGLEVGSIERVGGSGHALEGVVVGWVRSVRQHPDADRLRLCRVDVGGPELLDIVCGASNVAEGQKVPVATAGAVLHPTGSDKPLKIKEGKIRGEVSMGMICAEDELGLGTSHEGIMVLDPSWAPGTPFAKVLDKDSDTILEVDLTPNRVDAASHFGVARDLGATLRRSPRLPARMLDPTTLDLPHPIPVTIADPDRCKRYTSIYIEGVTVADSPDWLQQRLRAIGLRPINNVVDITNYVLHELGHPLHAFDADQLEGRAVVVRTLAAGETFQTLDGVDRALLPGEDLMICDAGRPLCIAGVMGGSNSGVTAQTRNIFLESAYFDAGTVRRTAKRLGISTDSSFRFERGADPHMTLTAALRAAALIVDLAGGRASQVSDQQTVADFPPFELSLSVAKAHRLIGKAIDRDEIVGILQALEIGVEADPDGDRLHLRVPPYRVDVQRDVDVLEDLLRVYGYNHVELPGSFSGTLSFRAYQDRFRLRERYANALSANGYYEILTNSLVSRALGDDKAVPILNPLSEDLGIMRQSMLPGALDVLRYNQNRQQETLAFYEFGKTYRQWGAEYEEKEWLAITVAGTRHPMHWEQKAPGVSLATLTREVERIQAWFGFAGKLREVAHPEFDYGMELVYDGRVLLRYGRVAGELSARYDLRSEAFHLVADWPALADLAFRGLPTFRDIPLYPSIRRDVSLLVPTAATFGHISEVVSQANPRMIRAIDLHDIYRGPNIPEGQKSYLISIELRDDKKTLEDSVADKVMQRVYQLLEQQAGATIRR
ncbi:MAG: phenylalanine--tRNA ligase subunit beta [Bacteroidia bacterium]